ncbi:hypothetical protein [Rheinheimera sp. 4Y26]|uniref:hypothetical protein n=1 Tax=Rheinheimera sp. 4Y26 TaxID=2977811 RepID=UPI0021B0AF3E|nr:hypothetical protein [Rheinheimera sp. 4Y26]MCT6699224.1 hypothetical protein [Rheinheimera sp. 4Y26]
MIKSAFGFLLLIFSTLLWADSPAVALADNPAQADSTATQPLVVVHTAVAVQSLTAAQLRSIYLKRQVIWPDGLPVQVFVLPLQSAVHKEFSQTRLKLFPYQLERNWQKLTFSGIGTPPTEVSSATDMLRLIQTTPGAIGYLPFDHETTDAKVIQIKP